MSGPGAGAEHVVSCGYFNWIYCYERASALCPGGYKVVAESEGMGPRELRISCRDGQRPSRS